MSKPVVGDPQVDVEYVAIVKAAADAVCGSVWAVKNLEAETTKPPVPRNLDWSTVNKALFDLGRARGQLADMASRITIVEASLNRESRGLIRHMVGGLMKKGEK